MRPLAGIKVIEIAQNLAGPFASEILARLGAEVVKVERPEGGDDARGWGPPFVAGAGSSFHSVNAGKRSITLDLKDASAVAWLERYVAGADVLVENLRPGSLEALGLGQDALLAVNPRLVYCSISAFGRVGPLKDRPGYEPMMQAFAGLMLTTGFEDSPPLRLGVPVLDYGTGMWGAIGVLAALVQRAHTGRGCVVDAALFETALGWLTGHVASFQASGKVSPRHPTGSARLVPFQGFETRTGPIIIAVGNDRLFVALAQALDRPEWGEDPRFRTNADRFAHKDLLVGEIEAVLMTRDQQEWLDRLDKAGVPAAPINTLRQVLVAPQTVASEILQRVPGIEMDHVGLPLRFDGQRPPQPGPAPALGEHTKQILDDSSR
jgi:crotonobetainyl-CoA:carnitine CoA-transferase CaiB-like acyl-CoA transferase